MKKLLLSLNAAILSIMVALAASTPAPVITINKVGSYTDTTTFYNAVWAFNEICFFRYQVTATGVGDVHLYLNGEEVENPYTFTYLGDLQDHFYDPTTYPFTATAQAQGYEMSEASVTYDIPPLSPFYFYFNEDDAMIVEFDEVMEGMSIMYKLSRFNQEGEWKEYDGPFEIWRAPENAKGNCSLEVMLCYDNGLTSNIGIENDLTYWILGSNLFEYYEYKDGIYYFYENYWYFDGTPFTYNYMCNRYQRPSEHMDKPSYSGDVVIPESVDRIMDSTFYYCTELTSVTFPEYIFFIGYHAFDGCTGLENVYISSLKGWCSFLFLDELSNPLHYAKHLILNGKEITDLLIPSEEIGDPVEIYSMTFAGYQSLNTITCRTKDPDQLGFIESNAFYGLYDTVILYVPDGSIEAYRAHMELGKFTHIESFPIGDVDGDRIVSVTDVTYLIDLLLAGEAPAYCDVNNDGVVDICDLTAIIDIILNAGE